MSRRRKRLTRQEKQDLESLYLIIFLVILACVIGQSILAWFSQRPWAIALAVCGGVPGILGIFGFFVTASKINREEERRRLVAEDNWLKLTPRQFEEYVAEILKAKGYKVQLTIGGADEGVDIHISNADEKSVVQCKRYNATNSVGVKAIREFDSVVNHFHANRGYFVTSSYFTRPAIQYAQEKPITLVDANELAKWMKDVDFGPYAVPLSRPPLFFTVSQWLVLTMLMMGVMGVFGMVMGVLATYHFQK